MGKKKRGKKNGLKNMRVSETGVCSQQGPPKDNISTIDNSEKTPKNDCYLEIQSSLDRNIGINFVNIETIFGDIHSKLNTDLCIPWSKWITN